MTDESRTTLLGHGAFQIDLVRECLIFEGEPQTLRHQSFQVLYYLACHPCRTVTKDELQSAIWKETCVTDNALVQCIAEVRRALRDDPKTPTYIKTVPRQGYRFLVSFIEEKGASERSLSAIHEMSPAKLKTPPPVSAELKQPLRFRAVAVSAAFLLFLGLTGLQLFTRHSVHLKREAELPKIAGVKRIRMESIRNETGDPEFNWVDSGMPEMLKAGLQNIPGVEISDDEKGTVRVQAVLSGSMIRQGYGYSLKIDTLAADGHLLGSDFIPTERKKFPLEASLIASLVAEHLGLSVPDRAIQEEALTSDSMDAAGYYQQGVALAERFETKEAIELLKKAVALDPGFAMAYARIGYAYAVVDFAPKQGLPYLLRASSLSDRLTEKQRLYIAAWRATAEENYDEAARIYATITQRCPHDPEAFRQLAKLQRSLEHLDAANATLQSGLTANPNASSLFNVKAIVELAQYHYSAAIVSAQEYLRLSPNEPNAHDTLGMTYQQAGKLYQAIAEFSAALSLDPEFEPAIVHMGDVYFQAGRYEEAIQQYRRYIGAAHTDAARAIGYGNIAAVYRQQQNLKEAAKAAEREIHYDPHAIWNSLVIAVDEKHAAKVHHYEVALQSARNSQERGTPGDRRTIAYQRGWLALQRGDRSKAIASFQEALQHIPATSGIDLHDSCLADAFMQLGMQQKAETEYRRLLANNPSDPFALRGIHSIAHNM
ncbi:tetratricopeptide repeat protein [Terriglobus saanensis]|uniref:Transcriptional regulator, CadC n=1 Tax=Terriglobus saanensis (strain ATCC BAA-1853 / DSM 23119 / SP1PR4) TaxID=401053 RepID=E8V398_TERSS|nr:tetratricopeptide repeat protein [Terriglobus saanensis]ADV82455.1 transcriptional regulator, CadC [Terriglobus saanensis SP1PR4]